MIAIAFFTKSMLMYEAKYWMMAIMVCVDTLLFVIGSSSGNFITLNMTLPVDVVLDVEPGMAISALVSALSDAVAGQLDAVKSCLLRHFSQVLIFYCYSPCGFGSSVSLIPCDKGHLSCFSPLGGWFLHLLAC